jgi:hypothetical protein
LQLDSFKDFILFNVICNDKIGADQQNIFDETLSNTDKIKDSILDNLPTKKIYSENKQVFGKIKDLKIINESKANQLINQ